MRSHCSETDCDYYGAYDPADSTTSTNTTDEYSIYYSDGTRGTGYYYRDHLQVSGLAIDDFLFASGSVDDYSNIAGLGYINDSTRSVLPYVLQRNGLIQRSLFSVFSDSTTSTGAIIFGGLDSGKYTGTLETVPVIGTQGWNIYVSGIASECGFSNQNSFIVNIDTGSQVSLLPSSLYHQINQLFGGSLTSDMVYPYGMETYLFK
ncbi:acid protease, partial [Cyberlindnera jadinii NRRL Y-1542]